LPAYLEALKTLQEFTTQIEENVSSNLQMVEWEWRVLDLTRDLCGSNASDTVLLVGDFRPEDVAIHKEIAETRKPLDTWALERTQKWLSLGYSPTMNREDEQ